MSVDFDRRKLYYVYMRRRYAEDGAAGVPAAEKKKGSAAVLFVGFAFCMLAFLMVLVPLLMLLIPGGAAGQSVPLSKSALYLNIIAVILAFVGIIMCSTAPAHNKAMARFAFAFGILAFLLGVAFAVMCIIGSTARGISYLLPF